MIDSHKLCCLCGKPCDKSYVSINKEGDGLYVVKGASNKIVLLGAGDMICSDCNSFAIWFINTNKLTSWAIGRRKDAKS